MIKQTIRDNKVYTMTVNSFGRIERIEISDGRFFVYEYDNKGRIISTSDNKNKIKRYSEL